MRFSKGVNLVVALTAVLGILGISPAQAATDAIFTDTSFEVSGLIVKYKPGVAAVAANGRPTAENAAGKKLSLRRDIGSGWHSVSFSKTLVAGAAARVALRLAADPRVLAVDLDRRIRPASIKTRVSLAKMTALKPASAVRSLKATDAWSNTSPDVATVKLRWSAPLKLNSAKISGYRIERNEGSGWTFVSNSLVSAVTISQGMRVGVKYSFRVAAVTKLSGAQKIGTFSSPVTVTATGLPQPPVINGANIAFGDTAPSWAPQNFIQTGGLPLLGYTATATATGQEPVICKAPATATSCAFTGLVRNVTYTVSVVAKNTHGSTSSLPGVTPLDALFGQQWYLTSNYGINVTNAWSKTMGSKNVVVAVIDSGITEHPDLDTQVIPGYDFISDPTKSNDGDGWDSNNADPGDYADNQTSSWHGTHVAGLIGAQSNLIGVAGVAPNVKIQPIRVIGNDGGDSSDLIAALRWAAGFHVAGVPDNPTPAKVINLSMGTDTATACRFFGQEIGATEEALAEVKSAGVTVISAAGNSNTQATDSYPGNCYPTINVGATGYSGDRAHYSNYSIMGSSGQMYGVDISAPGGDSRNPGDSPVGTNGKILSTFNDGKRSPGSSSYWGAEGTSMAAPLVAGTVALLYTVKPDITFEQVWEVLKSTATNFPTGSDCEVKTFCGVGIVNAGAAVAAAAALP